MQAKLSAWSVRVIALCVVIGIELRLIDEQDIP